MTTESIADVIDALPGFLQVYQTLEEQLSLAEVLYQQTFSGPYFITEINSGSVRNYVKL